MLKERFEHAIKTDTRFQALYLTVVDIFIKQLRADLALLDKHRDFLRLAEERRKAYPDRSSPHLFGLSYAAKWAPTPQKGTDKQVYLSSALALMLFPANDVTEARRRLQGEVLTPLRNMMRVPESAMVHGPWKIDYTKVSLATFPLAISVELTGTGSLPFYGAKCRELQCARS